MKTKTAELTGEALDFAVAKCEAYQYRYPWRQELDYRAWKSMKSAWGMHPDYSSDYAAGGQIMDREKLSTEYDAHWELDPADPEDNGERWLARTNTYYAAAFSHYGPTRLVAAMRCYVASKLGEEIDLPEGLVP